MPEQKVIMNSTFILTAAETTMSQYRVAVLDTTAAGYVINPAAANASNIAGVLQDSTLAAEDTGNFAVMGISYVVAFAAIAVGDVLVVGDTAGRVKSKAAGATAQGLGVVGIALGSATAQDDIIPCRLQLINEYGS